MLRSLVLSIVGGALTFCASCSNKSEDVTEAVEATAEEAIEDAEAALDSATATEEEEEPATSATTDETSIPPSLPAASARKVFYAANDNVPIYAQANASGKVLSTLNKGDAVAGEEMGEWIALSNGGYVASKSVTAKGTGRKRGGGSWQ